ncbi:MAG: glutathione peroxidase, partial [Luminiphilus sp.]|nr:glutathione peroxidase [Luminiphilus sp.]
SSDDFWGQEADEEATAAEVCFEKYNVSFPVMATSPVKGAAANPIFKGLGDAAGYPKWNFNKYVVSSSGDIVGHFPSSAKPNGEEIRSAIEAALPTS